MSRPPLHPGEIPGDELEEIGITPKELAGRLAVPQDRINQIVLGEQSITGDTALRLGHRFQTSAEFWLNLQTSYDLRVAEQAVGREIDELPVLSRDLTAERPPL